MLTLLLEFGTVSFLLLVFGVLYAVRIALLPFADTWKSVVVGDGATAAGMSALLALFGYWFGLDTWQVAVLVTVPWWCLALTGLPMIGGQETKHELRKLDMHALRSEEDHADAA
jgi:hypothetical protein